MISILSLLAAIGLALLGCGYIALSQSKHSKAVLNTNANPALRIFTRLLGWSFIAASFVPCVIRDGWGFAVLTWSLVVPSAAMIISLLLAYRPAWLRAVYKNGTSFFT
ncbi:DUF3325 domain-containing protein [Hyphococcus sp.]|uniref:DUF3325 domain-containing protein n=1 Tax=Hyphococcus sp. TaxID=2038636 RepID=UPI003CCBF63F